MDQNTWLTLIVESSKNTGATCMSRSSPLQTNWDQDWCQLLVECNYLFVCPSHYVHCTSPTKVTEAKTSQSVWLSRWDSWDFTRIVSYLTKMIMFPLSLVTRYTEPRRKAWAETGDRIRHGHQVTSSEYWTDGDNQTASGDKQNTGWITQHPDIGTIVLTRGHRDGAPCQDGGGWLSILNTVFSPLCGARLSYAGAGLIRFISGQPCLGYFRPFFSRDGSSRDLDLTYPKMTLSYGVF